MTHKTSHLTVTELILFSAAGETYSKKHLNQVLTNAKIVFFISLEQTGMKTRKNSGTAISTGNGESYKASTAAYHSYSKAEWSHNGSPPISHFWVLIAVCFFLEDFLH